MHEFHSIRFKSFPSTIGLKAILISEEQIIWSECGVITVSYSHTSLPLYFESECFHDNNIKAKFILKGIVQPQIKFLSLISHPHVVPNRKRRNC